MKDPKTRELMARIYRLVEKYEEPCLTRYVEDAKTYFDGLWKDINEIRADYEGNEFARELLIGLYAAIGDRFDSANALPLVSKNEAAEKEGK